MTAVCLASIRICRVRATRLDQDGNPLAGPNNVVVSDTPMQLIVNSEILAGERKNLVGGCDCVVATYHGYDKLLGFTLELDKGLIEPPLEEMLLGGTIIQSTGVAVGLWAPIQVSCADPPQPNVAFEAWTDAWDSDHPADSPYRYHHWLFPSTHWQEGQRTLQNDFAPPKLTAWTRSNPNWGLGIFGDQPEDAGSHPYGHWLTDTLPAAFCDYQSHAIT